MQSSVVRSGRAELAVTTWGAAGMSILALHPGVGDSRIWQWCGPVWAAAGHRVIAYDRRGFGHTRYVPEPHGELNDLLAVVAATGAQPAIVVGNSRGGGLALDLALAHPGHVAGLVLVAPSASGYPEDEWVSAAAELEQDAMIARAARTGDLDLVNRLEVRYWLDGVEQPEGRVEGPPRELMIEMNGRALKAGPVGTAVRQPPVWPRLTTIDVPVVVVAGEHDLPGMSRMCRDLVAAVPNGRLVMIEETAHCPSLDQPERLNRVVLDFVNSITR
jgi:pimeloyl-ACP methyl ester carboxylesterase